MRAFLTVLDSFGIGGASDAAEFGDSGSDTLLAVSRSTLFRVPNLIKMGLGNIDNVSAVPKVDDPNADVVRLKEKGKNKDTLSGHWELTGVVAEPFRTFPDGFPEELIDEFERVTGYEVLVNAPYSGTSVIRDWGKKQTEGKRVIVYTSADSVLQIAAHTDVVPLEELYRICSLARKIADGYGIARVIARPFSGSEGNYYRTPDRRDFSMPPPAPTLLDALKEKGFDVIAVGKINDIFCGRGITEAVHTSGNADGITRLKEFMTRDFNGLCFVNLVDFDMLYGHRNDINGYAAALSAFDESLDEIIKLLKPEDLFIITADHGCDPSTPSTDHSREDVPALFYAGGAGGHNFGTVSGFGFVAEKLKRFFGLQ